LAALFRNYYQHDIQNTFMIPNAIPPTDFVMEYHYPPGFPLATQTWDEASNHLAASLKGVDIQLVQIPGTEIWVQLFIFLNGASLEFKKDSRHVYTNFFSFDKQSKGVFAAVKDFYKKYKLGTPRLPKQTMWVHSIPRNPKLFSQEEKDLCERLTMCFFWAAFGQRLRKQN